MTAQEAEIYPWSESDPAERLSEEHGSTGGANLAWHYTTFLCTWDGKYR